MLPHLLWHYRLVFHYVFIPWLQSELDTYREEANDTRPRFDKNKILPHGRPLEIFRHPEDYGTCDFAVCFNVISL